MSSAFHQLCPRYSGTLTPTAPTAIRLWETFTFLQKIYPTYNTMTLKKGQVTNNEHVSNLSQSHIMQAGIKTYNFDFGIDG